MILLTRTQRPSELCKTQEKYKLPTMSALSFAGRLPVLRYLRSSSRAVTAAQIWRFYSPKGSQSQIVKDKRRRAVLGGGEKRLEKQHKNVS